MDKDKTIWISSVPIFRHDRGLSELIAEKTECLMNKLGIGISYSIDARSVQEICREEWLKDKKEENHMANKHRYLGKTITALVDGSTDSELRVSKYNLCSDSEYSLVKAEIGDLVQWDDYLFEYAPNSNPYRKPIWKKLMYADVLKATINSAYGVSTTPYNIIVPNWLCVKKVIFNNPATIVFWNDGTKTIVKCGENDVFDPEKGLAMAIAKKALGNQGNYFNQIKKWLPKPEEDDDEALTNTERLNKIFDAKKKLAAAQELICDMTFNGATKAELVRAIRFSRDMINASKGADIDITESVAKNGIAELEEKYQSK